MSYFRVYRFRLRCLSLSPRSLSSGAGPTTTTRRTGSANKPIGPGAAPKRLPCAVASLTPAILICITPLSSPSFASPSTIANCTHSHSHYSVWAQKLSASSHPVLVNACHPGDPRTKLSEALGYNLSAPRDCSSAAALPVFLALHPDVRVVDVTASWRVRSC